MPRDCSEKSFIKWRLTLFVDSYCFIMIISERIKHPYLFNAFFQLLFTVRTLLRKATRMSFMTVWRNEKSVNEYSEQIIIYFYWTFWTWSTFLFGAGVILCQCQMWRDKLALPRAGVGPDDLHCLMVPLTFKIISVMKEITYAYGKMLLCTKFYPLLWLCSAVRTVESHQCVFQHDLVQSH